jgi:hypothetical protein
MHAIVTRVTLHDEDAADSFLKEQVVPRMSGAPGFIAGYWVRTGTNTGNSIAAFESEEQAQAVVDNVQQPPEGAVTIEVMEVGEVVASA